MKSAESRDGAAASVAAQDRLEHCGIERADGLEARHCRQQSCCFRRGGFRRLRWLHLSIERGRACDRSVVVPRFRDAQVFPRELAAGDAQCEECQNERRHFHCGRVQPGCDQG